MVIEVVDSRTDPAQSFAVDALDRQDDTRQYFAYAGQIQAVRSFCPGVGQSVSLGEILQDLDDCVRHSLIESRI